jgi:hypothetical protein
VRFEDGRDPGGVGGEITVMIIFDEQDIDEALIDSIELEDIEDSRRGFE